MGKIDRTEDNLLEWARVTHLECLKTELILKEMIIPIEMNNVFKTQSRRVIELMYLLSARCFFNMSFVKDQLEHENHPIVQNLKRTVQDVYESVCQKFNQYSSALTKKESQIGSIIGDRFSKIFNGSEMKEKDKFLVGLENIEFKK